MQTIMTVKAMRESDQRTIAGGVSGRELMRRAAGQLYENVHWCGRTEIVCGAGNNAGDGYALAELMHAANLPCRVIRLSDQCSSDGAYYLNRCIQAGVPVIPWTEDLVFNECATIVDCIWGTGFHGSPAGVERSAIERINQSRARVVSVDINSGLNGENGMADLCVHSDLTISIGHFQPGHFLNRAKDVMKRKIAVDIGISPLDTHLRLAETEDFADLFAPRPNDAHKGSWGYMALIGGSERYSGAIRLAAMANAAMRSGAGVARVVMPRGLYHDLLPLVLESTLFPLSDRNGTLTFRENELREAVAGTRAVAFGMGIGISDDGQKALSWLMAHYPGRLVVDADGLTMLASLPREVIASAAGPRILTPHIGEFSRLTGKSAGEILSDPIANAEEYASTTGSIVLLKGPTTIITDGQETWLTDRGCAGMATAGSGDVLSGILTALLCRAADPLRGTAAAAFIHGWAGELAQERMGSIAMTASDTAARVPEVVLSMERSKINNSD